MLAMKNGRFCGFIVILNTFLILQNQRTAGNMVKRITISRSVTQIRVPIQGNTDFDAKETTSTIKMKHKVEFVLYNSLVPNGTLIESPDELNTSNFFEKVSTKFITHGWLSSGSLEACQTIKNGYLKYTDANIFIVNWEKIAHSILYLTILQQLVPLADFYADFLKQLIEMKEIDLKNIHLIGHSLGAHISGMVGKRLIADNMIIRRITGLDPAFPGFSTSDNANKLSVSDAEFVDVIHTSGGTLGILDPIGHADFYPNGGSSPMPGCETILMNEPCSHSRSWQYFAESISNPFYAIKCESLNSFYNRSCKHELQQMGEHTPIDARGNFYLITNSQSPFSLGIEGVKFTSSKRKKR